VFSLSLVSSILHHSAEIWSGLCCIGRKEKHCHQNIHAVSGEGLF